ncbi:MAG: hypothetical protein LBC63_05115 [Holophagales bacterium]|nr:hypothetical protein [Holophagales bacterium]
MIVLTPAMQQKLKLWKPSLQELSRTIEEELEKNPVLEVQDYFSEAPTAGDLMEGRESKVLGEAPIAEGLD